MKDSVLKKIFLFARGFVTTIIKNNPRGILSMLQTIGPKFRRALHYDFHTSPGVKNIFGNFDAEKFAQQLADANIEPTVVSPKLLPDYRKQDVTRL